MYTENNEYTEEENEKYIEDNRRGIIIKVIIILICLIILIWLIFALKKNNNSIVTYDPKVHVNNINDIRLAGEKYFFIDGNMPKKGEVKVVNLAELKKTGLKEEIIDANNKVCNDVKSLVSLNEEDSAYALKINLSCSTNENEEIFYYKKDNYACLNCNGKTLMEDKDKSEEEDNNVEEGYNCNKWSSWTTVRIKDSDLEERTRKVYLAVKENNLITYSNWSEYTKNPIQKSDGIEIETKEVIESTWSEIKQTNDYITESDKIKIVSTYKEGSSSYTYCPKGYNKENNKCVSESVTRGDLTYIEYNSGNYVVYNKPCDSLNVEPNDNGTTKLVYKNCKYRQVTNLKTGYSGSYTVYSYQELIETPVTYYRYRTKTNNENVDKNLYTNEYYEINQIPKGYVRVVDSEKIEYSYKLATCIK